jgi:hypothetical protein
VAAVATILGLLLVVTFIANYLTTTLPNQMSVNDLNHEIQVENQVGRLQALLTATAEGAPVGAEVVQPFALGSDAAPPFAGQDGSSLSQGVTGANSTINFALSGPGGITQPFAFAQSAALVLQLHNTYAPTAEVAYDQGAVIYAQTGGYPIMIDGPQISYAGTSLSLWIPSFTGTPAPTAGAGTVVASLRLLSVESVSIPSNSFSMAPGSVVIVVHTPYALAWKNYFAGLSSFHGLVTCTPSAGVACTSLYSFGAPLGTITITIPTTGLSSFSIAVAQFSVGFN